MGHSAPHQAILEALQETNPDVAIDEVGDDDDLVDLGYLDSLRAMELVAILEERFEIDIALEAIDPRSFRTIGRIHDLLLAADGN